jgi:hypothetical protein
MADEFLLDLQPPPLAPAVDDTAEQSDGTIQANTHHKTIQRKKKKALPKEKQTKVRHIKVEPTGDETETKVVLPAIRPLSELIQAYPNFGINSRPVPMGVAATTSSSADFEPVLPQPTDIPPAVAETRRRAKLLYDAIQPIEVIPTGTLARESKAVITNEIRTLRADPPISTARHESKLLRAAGRYRYEGNGEMYDFPACRKGDKCVGMTEGPMFRCIPSPSATAASIITRCVLMAWMKEDEWYDFIKTGRPVTKERDCVLCIRATINDFILWARGSDPVELRQDVPLQPYINLFAQEEGYIDSAMNRPAYNGKWEGMVGPLAMLKLGMLVWDVTRYGQPIIDQSAMIWNAPAQLTVGVGENLY